MPTIARYANALSELDDLLSSDILSDSAKKTIKFARDLINTFCRSEKVDPKEFLKSVRNRKVKSVRRTACDFDSYTTEYIVRLSNEETPIDGGPERRIITGD